MKEINLKDSTIQDDEEHKDKQDEKGEEQQEQSLGTNDLLKE